MRPGPRMLLDCVLLLCALCAAAGLGGAWSDVLDFPNNFAPLWVAAGSLAGLAGLRSAPRRRLRAAMLALVLGSGGLRIVRELLARPHLDKAAAGPVLRIVQFNAWAENPDTRAAARWLIGQHADIVVVEEVPADSPLAAALARAYPHVTGCAGKAPCSTLIFSRAAPLAAGGLARGDPENRQAVSAAWARFAGPGGAFTVVGVHMTRPWPWRVPLDEVGTIGRLLDSAGRDGAIVAGDFNRTGWSAALARIDRRFALPRITRALPTWPRRFGTRPFLPLLPLDQVYAGRRWAVRAVTAGPDLGSDHLPVVVTLSPAAARH